MKKTEKIEAIADLLAQGKTDEEVQAWVKSETDWGNAERTVAGYIESARLLNAKPEPGDQSAAAETGQPETAQTETQDTGSSEADSNPEPAQEETPEQPEPGDQSAAAETGQPEARVQMVDDPTKNQLLEEAKRVIRAGEETSQVFTVALHSYGNEFAQHLIPQALAAVTVEKLQAAESILDGKTIIEETYTGESEYLVDALEISQNTAGDEWLQKSELYILAAVGLHSSEGEAGQRVKDMIADADDFEAAAKQIEEATGIERDELLEYAQGAWEQMSHTLDAPGPMPELAAKSGELFKWIQEQKPDDEHKYPDHEPDPEPETPIEDEQGPDKAEHIASAKAAIEKGTSEKEVAAALIEHFDLDEVQKIMAIAQQQIADDKQEAERKERADEEAEYQSDLAELIEDAEKELTKAAKAVEKIRDFKIEKGRTARRDTNAIKRIGQVKKMIDIRPQQ